MRPIDLISRDLAKYVKMRPIDPKLLPDRIRATPSPAELGAAIRERRRSLGITQDELATTIGVNRKVVGQLENGKETVHVGIVLRAARAVGLAIGAEPRG